MDIQDKLQGIFPKHYRYGNILLINACNLEVMKHVPDKEFCLACVDPPYGIGKDGQSKSTGGNGGRKAHDFKGWDSEIPPKEYFDELFRVSKNQIIWGANYFAKYLPGSMGWILWDKGQRINQSDGELAFTSFERALRVFTCNRVELLKEGTIHPTQKPIKLYQWLLANYAQKGQHVFDSHGGGMSIAIACHNLGYKLTLCEIDEDYYREGVKRIDIIVRQASMFQLSDLPVKTVQQKTMF